MEQMAYARRWGVCAIRGGVVLPARTQEQHAMRMVYVCVRLASRL